MIEKHESDLTPRERRKLEAEKIKSLGWKERLQYLWTYYKHWLLVLIGIAALIGLGQSVYQNSQMKELLSFIVLDTGTEAEEGAERLKSDLTEYLGTGEKYETVEVTTMLSSTIDSSAGMKQTVLIGAGETDLLVCGEEMYEQYHSEGLFLDWEEILDDDYGTYEKYLTDGKLDLAQSQVWNSYGLTAYEPVYMGVVLDDNQENIRGLLEYLFGN